jgi:hypothetical protein
MTLSDAKQSLGKVAGRRKRSANNAIDIARRPPKIG